MSVANLARTPRVLSSHTPRVPSSYRVAPRLRVGVAPRLRVAYSMAEAPAEPPTTTTCTWDDLLRAKATQPAQLLRSDNYALKWLRYSLVEDPFGEPRFQEFNITAMPVSIPPLLRPGPIDEAYNFDLPGERTE